MPKANMLSIIIVNFRTWAYSQQAIDFLLSSLPSEILLNREIEIIVLDNHSNDGGIENFRAKNPCIRVLTKSEAIISKFVYFQKHLDGLERQLAAAWMRMDNYSSLFFWTGMMIFTLGLARLIKEQFLIRRRVAKYLLHSHKNNVFLSDKSKNFAPIRT